MLTRITFLTALVVALTFTAQEPTAYGQADSGVIKRARALYYKSDFTGAFNMLRSALPTIPDNKTMAQARLLIGMIQLAQGNFDQAGEEFDKAVLADPQLKLTSAKYPPQVVKMYSQARARNLGSIIIQTDPSDAEVYVDGALYGLSPVPVDDLVVGKHAIRIVKTDYRVEEREVEVNGSERTEFYLELSIADDIAPTISHQPEQSAREGSSLRVKANAQDNIAVAKVVLNFRKKGAADYESVDMYQSKKGFYEGVVARDKVFVQGLQYYITAVDSAGNTTYEGKPNTPFEVRVTELDRDAPRLFHTPITTSSDASKLVIKAKVIDNKKLAYVKLFYAADDETKYIEENMRDTAGSGNFAVTIPDVFMNARKIRYYIEASDDSGNRQYSGRNDAPHVITMFRARPFKQGYVVDRKKDGDDWTKTVTVNVGTLKGYKKGQVFTVFDASDKVVDPETNMVLAVNQKLTGKVRIKIPGPTSSQAKIIKEYDEHAVRKGNLIRLRPSAPTGVGGYSEKFRQITVTWNQSPEPEVKGYFVYRSENRDGPFEQFKKISERDSVETLDKGSRKHRLVDGKKYFYRARAYNKEKALSDFSEVGFVIAKGGPNPPSMVDARSGKIRQIPITWGQSADPETRGYKILRADSKTAQYNEIANITSSETTSYTDKPGGNRGLLGKSRLSRYFPTSGVREPEGDHELVDGKTYWYKMVSYNKSGKLGNFTEPVMAASRKKPAPPSGVRVIGSAVRSISLAWNRHPDPEIVKYRLYRHTGKEGTFKLVKEINDRSVTEYTDRDKSGKTITDGQAYYYRITAVNRGGAESELSPVAGGSTFGPPPAPSGISAVSGLVKQVLVRWNPVPAPEVVGYSIYRGKTPDNFEMIKRITGRNTGSFRDAGTWNKRLADGTTYYYTVKSINSVDVESQAVQTAKAVTKPVPEPPSEVKAAQGQKGKTMISWSPNQEPDIDSYRLLRSTSPGSGFKTIASVKAVLYEDSGLKNGAVYYYRVQAIDKDNLIGKWSPAIAVHTKPLPAPPTGLSASSAINSVTLSWNKNPEPDVEGYIIYSVGFFGKQKVGKTAKESYVVRKLKPDAGYSYVVSAVDKDGLASRPSAPVQVRTLK